MAQAIGVPATEGAVQASRECVVCMQVVHPTDLVTLACGDLYCRLCLNECFENATLNEASFPPACAHGSIDFTNVKTSLFRAVSEAFESKAEEFSTPNRTYCYEPTCSAWIRPSSIQNNIATCHACSSATCVFCKAKVHDDECSEDPAVKSFMVTAQQEGYRQCSQCRRMIERYTGCNHIT